MLAVVKTKSKDGPEGTEVRDCPRPKPAPDQMLIRVAAAAICGTDKHIYHWDPSIHDSVKPPRIYGHEFCGFIEEIGERAHRPGFNVGDYVSAEMHVVDGECPQCRSGNGHICINTKIYGLHEDGAFAEFVTVPASNGRSSSPADVKRAIDAVTDGVGVDVVMEMSGSAAAINFGLYIVRMGGTLSLLGLPAGQSVTINDYTRNVIFKGVTLHGII